MTDVFVWETIMPRHTSVFLLVCMLTVAGAAHAQSVSVTVTYPASATDALTAAWHAEDPGVDHDDDPETPDQHVVFGTLNAWLVVDLESFLTGKVDYQNSLVTAAGCVEFNLPVNANPRAGKVAALGFDPCP